MALNGISNFGANMAHRNLQKSNAGLSLALAKLAADEDKTDAGSNDAESIEKGRLKLAEEELQTLRIANTRQSEELRTQYREIKQLESRIRFLLTDLETLHQVLH